jgi:hypothetical protein
MVPSGTKEINPENRRFAPGDRLDRTHLASRSGVVSRRDAAGPPNPSRAGATVGISRHGSHSPTGGVGA